MKEKRTVILPFFLSLAAIGLIALGIAAAQAATRSLGLQMQENAILTAPDTKTAAQNLVISGGRLYWEV